MESVKQFYTENLRELRVQNWRFMERWDGGTIVFCLYRCWKYAKINPTYKRNSLVLNRCYKRPITFFRENEFELYRPLTVFFSDLKLTSSLSRSSKQSSSQPKVSDRKWTNRNAKGVSVDRVKVLANWNATRIKYYNGEYTWKLRFHIHFKNKVMVNVYFYV